MFYMGYKPHTLPSRRYLESFNELMFMLVLYQMFLCSNGTLNNDVNYWAGYGTVITVLLVMTVNIGNMLRNGVAEYERKTRMTAARTKYHENYRKNMAIKLREAARRLKEEDLKKLLELTKEKEVQEAAKKKELEALETTRRIELKYGVSNSIAEVSEMIIKAKFKK